MPPQGAAADDAQEGGSDPAQVLAEAGATLEKAVSMLLQDPQVPNDAKKAFQAALAAFSDGAQQLTGGAPQAGGNAAPEQGASGAQPMSMQRPG